MNFFYRYFGDNNYTSESTNEMHVRCPFPHKDPETGETYIEKHASAHINTEKDVFHCKVCGESHSEASFMAKVNKIKYSEALRIIEEMEENGFEDNWTQKQENLNKSPTALNLVKSLGLANVFDELRIGYEGAGISFPVFMNGVLLATCRYDPKSERKALLSRGAKSFIFPYDLWVEDDRPTLLCAGFKDAAIARAYNFNSITFTHGENSFPKMFKYQFKGRKVFIAYDNDAAGKEGAIKAATFIKEVGGDPFIVDLSTVCTEKGEDIHDFFMKYRKTSDDLRKLMEEAPVFDDELYEKERNKHYPLVQLEESTQGKYHNRVVSSRVAVTAKWEQSYRVPEVVEFVKFTEPSKTDVMDKGEKRVLTIEEDNIQDVLYLCDSGLKEDQIKKNLKKLAKIPVNEKGVAVKYKSYVNVFKAMVTDDITSQSISNMTDSAFKPMELIAYSLERSLNPGEKARIFYKPVAHPLQAQQVVSVVTAIEESDIAIKNFKVTEEVLESLKVFQPEQEESVKDKMHDMMERAKALAGPETRPELAWAVDLFYHTPLQFKWNDRLERGYLDAMIIGESRTGKSQTAKKLMETYELGMFTSLKTATKAGIIGGSDQTAGGYKTKLGVIPRNHKGALIMEEFSGASHELIGQLTDIRSSNMVRLERVNGTTTAPAMVRMLSLSNVRKGYNGENIPIREHPSGVDVVSKLIGTAEDIGRYDFFLLVDKPKEYTDPNTKVEKEAYPKESYLNRVRWIWSRSADQIILDEATREYIVEASNKLNRDYDCHINFFGPEAWKKLTRVSIAVAAMLCSVDETGQKLIVKPDHVDWAKNFLIACYGNELFNLKSYVEEERKYTTCPQSSVVALQGMYNQHKTLILQLSKGADFSQSQIRAISGLDNTDFNKVFNRLSECYFVKYSRSGERIMPTERFRRALKQIKTNEYMAQIGSEV